MPNGAAEEFVIDVTAKFNDEATKGAADVDKEISKLSKDAAAYGKAMDTARQKVKSLEDEQRRLTERLNGSQSRYAAAKSKLDDYKSGVEALKNRLSGLRNKHQSAADAVKQLEQRLQVASSGYAEAKSRAAAYGSGVSALKNQLTGLTNQQKGVSTGISQIEKELKSATGSIRTDTTEISKLTSSLTRLKQQHDTLNGSIGSTKSRITEATLKYKEYAKQVTESQKKIKGLSGINASASEIPELTSRLEKLRAQQSALNGSITLTKEHISSASDAIKTQTESVKQSYQALGDLMGQSKRVDQELANNKKALNENAAAYTKVAQEQLKLRQQNPDTSSTTKPPTSKVTSTADAIKSAKGLESAGKTMNSVGNKLTLGVTTPLLTAGTVAIKTGMDFEDSLAKISTIADTSQMSISQLSSGIIKLSNSTGKTVGDLSEGLYQAISSGIQTKDTMQFMQTASKAAIGGFTDTETAVDGLTTVLNAYGMKSTEVGKIANQMMVAQNLGKTTFGEMAQEVGNAIPTFSSAQVGTKEFFSSLAVLTANGIHTQEAVTGLKSALSNIIKPSDDASKAAEALGIKFDTNELKSKGWMGFMQEVRGKLSQAAPAYMAAADKVASLNQQIEAQSQSGKKNNSVLKDLKQQLKGAKADMGALEKANGGTLSAFGTMFGSVEGLNSVLTLTSQQGVSLYNQSMKQMGASTDYVSDAFNKMHNTNGAKFKDEMNTLKNTAVGLATELMPLITEGLKKGEQFISMLGNLSKGQKSALGTGLVGAITVGPLLKTVGGAFSGIGKIKEFFAKHSSTASAVSGVAQVGTDAVKAASKTGLLTKAVSGVKTALGLIPLPLKIAGVAAAGVGLAMKAWHDYCVNDNLQKHFGDVQLSMEEVEDVAKRLTTTKWTAKVDTVVENDSKIADLQNDIKKNLEIMDKTKWKVSVGLKLTAEETSDFKSSVDSYIANAKSLIEQQHYTSKLAIDIVFPEGSAENKNTTQFTDAYYSGLNSEFATLGKQLADATNNALKDNIITDAEMDDIMKKRDNMQKKIDAYNQTRSEVKLSSLKQDALDKGLSGDSFSNLITEINSNEKSYKESAQKEEANVLVPFREQYKAGKISKSAYDQKVASVEHSTNQQIALNQVDTAGTAYDTIREHFSNEYAGVDKTFASDFEKYIQGNKTFDDKGIEWGKLFVGMEDQIKHSAIQGDSAHNIQTFTSQLKPQTDDLLGYSKDWINNGQSVPESYAQKLEKVVNTEVEGGDTTHMMEYAGMQMGKSPSYLKMIEQAKKEGANVPEEFMRGAEISSGKVFKNGIFTAADAASILPKDALAGLLTKMGVDAKSQFAISFQGVLKPEVQSEISTLMNGITGKQNGAQIGDLFKNANIDISSGLATKISKAKPELQTKTAGLLASVFSGVQLDNSSVTSLASNLGTHLDQGVSQKISDLSPEIQQGLAEACASADPAKAMQQLQEKFGASNPVLKGLAIDTDTAGGVAVIDLNGNIAKMNGITGSTVLKGMKIADIMNATAVAEKSVVEAQAYLNGHPLVETLTVQGHVVYDNPSAVGASGPIYDPNGMGLTAWAKSSPNAKKVPGAKATGGIVGTKSLTWLAEEGYPEMVIPFNPARRQRALGLWQQTGEVLGVKPQYHAAGGIVGSQFPQGRDPQEIFAAQPAVAAAAPVAAVASGSMNLGGVQIIVQGGDGDLVKVITAHKQEIAEAVAEVVNAAMDSANVPMAQGA